MKKKYLIKDENLILRTINRDDLEFLRKWRNCEDNRKWFINKGLISVKQQLEWYESYLKRTNDLVFIIEDVKNNNCSIGTASLYNIDTANLSAEFGRLIIGNDSYKGKGYAKRATELLCDFAFKELKLFTVYLEVLSNNERAINLYKRIGFRKESIADKQSISVLKMVIENR
ncbi:GNAT family N-acetyltransferase [Desulfitibacter alkalitolerans]|uniref:GNAT family N-acetyltransferase n=1 Tax=Desulfitibacter alkalitolerans TaxID=264641 RepID=UPI000685319B|nr:GNAT family N-acetyltransferase [Desulfitibacter alkalitolerans]